MRVFWGILALLLCGCATQAPDAPDATEAPAGPVADAAETVDRSHHLSCRNEKDPAQVDQLLNAASKKKGVVLYFHGGLSKPSYMEKELGPWLQQSIFSEPSMADYQVIFVNYDAGLDQWANLAEMFAELAAEFATSAAGQRAIQRFRDRFEGAELIENADTASPEDVEKAAAAASERARSWLQQAYSQSDYAGFMQEDASDEQLLAILSDDDLASDVGSILLEDPEFALIGAELDDYAKMLMEAEGAAEKGVTTWDAGLALAKALARIALRSNHQLVPTFIEEALAAFSVAGISIKDIAANHWSRVKKHAKECFAEGSPGYELATGLLALQRKREGQNAEFTINTVSHSAGSIPTGQLAKLLRKKGAQIDTAQLIVPAINQKDFRKLYMKNRKAIKTLRLYVLSGKAEASDKLAAGGLTAYPASLLYFVSGVADDAWYGDQLLLIAQHLKQDRRPYRWRTYRWVTRDDARPVWEYFAKPSHQDELMYYPGNISEPEGSVYKGAASHECTKYPWVSKALAAQVVTNISGASTVSIPDPTSKEALKKGREKCTG